LKVTKLPQVDERPSHLELQSELLPDLTGQFEDHFGESCAVGTWFFSFPDGHVEFAIDDALNPVQSLNGRQLLFNERASLLQGDDVRGELADLLEALMDRWFGHTKMPRGVGLGVTGVEVRSKGFGIDLALSHWLLQ
jgi:hypothetical protein